ncbi:sulfotransferase [Methylobacter sp.]|uniref:sulfotransferase n=1 Tax=Methylobacter sp. TaxID=2051955 RepID=UPI001219C4B6|nr:sulfotransferase [Methylobacter sp.]TAK61765.1 MAG: hypothetical protein EPO18_12855 [Methylobacter sp.]
MAALTDEFLIKINSGADLHQCQSYIGPHPDNINEIIPICYYGRSGTVFFSSLLDGHPEVIKTGNFDFREYFKYFDIMIGRGHVESQLSNCIRHYGKNMEYEGKCNQNFVEINNKLIHVPATLDFLSDKPLDGRLFFRQPANNDPFAYQGPYVGYVISTFMHLVETYFGGIKSTVLSEKDFFVTFNLAYNWAMGRQYAESVTKIAWNMHMPDPLLAKNAQKFFPKITLVHMIRKPLQTLGSHFKRYMYPTEVEVKNDIPSHDYVNKLFTELLSGDVPLVERRPGDDEFAIRLEDIHTTPEQTLRRVSQRLGISWSEVLLQSTYFGHPMVWNHSSQRGALTGFSTQHLKDDHPDLFAPDDIKFIEGVLYENYRQWDYGFSNATAMDKNIHEYVKKRIPVPLKMEVMCWERACQEDGAVRADIMKSYGLLRDAIEKRLERKLPLLELM